MSFTDNVGEFLSSMGPLANMINLEKVIGEEAAREHRKKVQTAVSVARNIPEPVDLVSFYIFYIKSTIDVIDMYHVMKSLKYLC